jgi:hypothetical protein
MTVAADDRLAWLRDSELRADDVNDALLDVVWPKDLDVCFQANLDEALHDCRHW